MAEPGCLHDAHFQNLEVSGDITVNSKILSKFATGTPAGSGFTGTTDAVSISVSEYSSEIVTSIFVDLGAGNIRSSGNAEHVVGNVGAANAYITQITTAINGVVYRVEMVCLEVPVGGDVDIDLSAHANPLTEDAQVQHKLINGDTAVFAQFDTANILVDVDMTTGIQDDYIYITHGTNAAPGVYTAGKFLIKFYGAKVTGL
jgi:hypothetical protein